MSAWLREHWVAGVALAILALAGAMVVASSLRRPAVETWPPTAPAPDEVGNALRGPLVYTVDASDSDRWTFFDFSRGSVVESPGPTEWDLAFRRFTIIANGGPGFAGRGGILELGEVPFDSVRTLPESGYVESRAVPDSANDAIARWYDYGWTSHLLEPRPRVYAVRTADGRYAKLRILGYYCPGARAGCVTFRYVYQGAGGTDLSPEDSVP